MALGKYNKTKRYITKKASEDSILHHLISNYNPTFDDFVESEEMSGDTNPWGYYNIIWNLPIDVFFEFLLHISFDFDNITDSYLSDVSSMIQEDSYGLDKIITYIKHKESFIKSALIADINVSETSTGTIEINILFDLMHDFGPSQNQINKYLDSQDSN